MEPDRGPHGTMTTRWPLPIEEDRWRGRSHVTPERLAEAWGTFLGRIPWQLFCTLTFDPTRRHPVGRELASREAYQWCGLVGYAYRRPVAWVYAVERHRSGTHHAHVLLTGLAAEANVSAAAELWRTRNGRVDARPVTNAEGVAVYATKSVAEGGEVVFSDTVNRYRHNLTPSPTVCLIGAG